MENLRIRPFLKWAGNKYPLLDRIRPLLPSGGRLIEPFAGSCAVFLGTDYASGLLVDTNPDLIGLYQLLKKKGEAFIRECASLFIPENNRPEVYYMLRSEFNRIQDYERRAALFLYLNRHGYNGLCRYNASGDFNVPVGRYARPYFPELEMRAFYKKAQGAEFETADFSTAMRRAVPGDIVYCDPPYVPLTPTANFTSYTRSGFGEKQQRELALLAEELAARGIPVIVSNHDTVFTVDAYRKATLTRFSVRRFISRDGKNRGKAAELLALFDGVRSA